jgi:hypothetical protein
MLDPQVDGCRRSSRAQAHQAHVQKAFDIRAKCRLELELRLERFGDALGARGGQLLTVSRGRAASGGYFAAVRYHLPLPRARAGGLGVVARG